MMKCICCMALTVFFLGCKKSPIVPGENITEIESRAKVVSYEQYAMMDHYEDDKVDAYDCMTLEFKSGEFKGRKMKVYLSGKDRANFFEEGKDIVFGISEGNLKKYYSDVSVEIFIGMLNNVRKLEKSPMEE